MANIHDGHRSRMRQRIRKSGIENLQPHEVLEWLLYYTIPRGDVNPLAHKLIQTFGSLSAVLEADYEALMAVEGVGEATAQFLCHYLDVYMLYGKPALELGPPHPVTAEEIVALLRQRFTGDKEETIRAVYLTAGLGFLKEEVVSSGSIRSVELNIRRLIESCLTTKASFVILAHNHPSKFLLPSRSDILTTMNVFEIMVRLNVNLLDHLIIGPDDYVSMGSSADYSYMFRNENVPWYP